MSSPPAHTDRRAQLLRLERLCWLVALALGFLQAWGRRHVSADGLLYIGADSIAYLDQGDAWLRGDWGGAVNAMWSPFYPWLTGLTLRLVQPTTFNEFTTVRLLNFLLYAASLAAFTYCLRALLRVRNTAARRSRAQGNETVGADTGAATLLPDWALLLISYALFTWTSLQMNRVSRISPDVLVAVWVYLASGLLLRMKAGDERRRNFVLLGVVLGAGYLTKTVMFPLAFVWLACALCAAGRVRHTLPRVVGALCVFLCIAAPFVGALSRKQQRLTIGDSAQLNYAWYVNGVTPFTHWQGEAPGGRPLHPTRHIFTAPDVYEFAAPVGGTYPPWYDPTYWYAGVTTHFDIAQQLRAVTRNLVFLARFAYARPFLLVVFIALMLLCVFGARSSIPFRDLPGAWVLLLPALTACALYALVNIEPRYLAPFVTLAALGLLAALRLPATRTAQRLTRVVVAIIVCACVISLAPAAARDAYTAARELAHGRAAAADVQWQIADALQKRGARPGAPVAVLGDAMYAAWPRLAHVRVVAELPEKPAGNIETFWTADEARRRQVIEAFARTGAHAVVTEHMPSWPTPDGWQRLGETNAYIYFLR